MTAVSPISAGTAVPSSLAIAHRDADAVVSRPAQVNIVRVILIAWAVLGTANVAASQLAGLDPMQALQALCSTAVGVVISLLLHRIMLSRAKAGREAGLMLILVASVVSGMLLWTADVSLQVLMLDQRSVGAWPWSEFLRLRASAVYFCALFVLQAAGCKLLGSELNLANQDRQLLEARLSALRFQLNPHFIFNTLNAISTLVAEAGARQAEEMIARLSDFLRASLSGEPTDLVALASEIDLVQAYLEIESVRFGDRLLVHYACEAGLADALVPSFILQPVVENAIKYAVAPSKEPVTVSIEATSNGGDLIVVVEDDGRHRAPPASQPSTGVGLANITARLGALYGAAGRIEAVRREVGFTVVVRIPLSRLAGD